MDVNKTELVIIEQAADKARHDEVRQLSDLQLAHVGGGIGENAPEVRRRICDGMGYLGLFIDAQRNQANAPVISTPESAASIRVIPTNEELMIARHTIGILTEKLAV